MRHVLLGMAAAFATTAVPASAAAPGAAGSGFSVSSGASGHAAVRVHRGGGFERDGRGHGEWRRDRDFRDEWRRDGDRRDHHDRGDAYFAYRDYQGDTLWRPDSFNDWWHERPSRAYPAWVARNTRCERLWWSGGDWRC